MNGTSTPARYAIAQEFALPVIKKVAVIIREIVSKEELVYNYAFDAFVLAWRTGLTRDTGFQMFREICEAKGLVNASNGDSKLVTIIDVVHKEYWQLASRQSYWKLDAFAKFEGRLDYTAVVGKWGQDAHDSLLASEARLRQMEEILTK